MPQFRDDDLFDAARLISAGASVEDASTSVEPAFVLLSLLKDFYEAAAYYSLDPKEALDELVEALEREDA